MNKLEEAIMKSMGITKLNDCNKFDKRIIEAAAKACMPFIEKALDAGPFDWQEDIVKTEAYKKFQTRWLKENIGG